jgi:hypothetical protein
MKTENIKFKAKELGTGKWKEGFLQRDMDYNLCILIAKKEEHSWYWTQIDPSTVCQFTGLKDCEGNELYEHDVIKNYPFIPSEIVWSEELSGYYLTHANGKIYEKPLGYYLSLGKFIFVGNKFDEENNV